MVSEQLALFRTPITSRQHSEQLIWNAFCIVSDWSSSMFGERGSVESKGVNRPPWCVVV